MAKENPQIGARIQRLRRQARTSQAELAEILGISASYLNLIEHNRRRITVPLLMKIAGHFRVEPGELVENDETRLTGDLMEIFGDDLFAESALTNQDIRDFALSNPSVGRAVVRLFDQYRQLKTNSGLGTGAPAEAGHHVATDAVSDFIQLNANHFPTLEAAAERVRADIDQMSENLEHGLRSYLFNVFGLNWRLAALPPGIMQRVDTAGREMLTAEALPPETSLFAVAHHLGLLAATLDIERLIGESELPADAPVLARNALASYFAAALIMPYEPFLKACQETRYDIERIGRRFRVSFEQVCHRMTTLQRPGQAGIPLHLVRTDIAGNISKRFSLSGIHIPRHAGACPRWNVYGAFLQQGQINVQISQMPEGQRYFCIARTQTKSGPQYNAPRRHFSIGLGCHISQATQMIYSDGVDLNNPALAVPIGVGCRICPRFDCEQRAHPPADHRFTSDGREGERSESIYVRPNAQWGR